MFRDFFIYSAEVLAAAGLSTTVARTNIDADADFECYAQSSTQISRLARVTQTESSSGRQMQDGPNPLTGAFSDGRHLFSFPVAKVFKRGSTLISNIVDESGAGNQVRLAYHGAKVFPRWPFPRPEYVARELFSYTVPFVAVATDPFGVGTIAVGGVGIYTVRIQEDADFEIRKWTITHDQAIPAASDSVALMMLSDESANVQLMDRPIPVESLGGAIFSDADFSANYPYTLRVPKLIRAGNVLTVTVRNLCAAPLALRMVLWGAKCYSDLPR
jgi:hypothetical protein